MHEYSQLGISMNDPEPERKQKHDEHMRYIKTKVKDVPYTCVRRIDIRRQQEKENA